MNTTFTVDLPWLVDLDTSELEQEIIHLQQSIIDSVNSKYEDLDALHSAMAVEIDFFKTERNKLLIENNKINNDIRRLKQRNVELITIADQAVSDLKEQKSKPIITTAELDNLVANRLVAVNKAHEYELEQLALDHELALADLESECCDEIAAVKREKDAYAAKNITLAEKATKQVSELKHKQELINDLTVGLESSNQLANSMETALTEADKNFSGMSDALDEYVGMNATLAQTNIDLKRNNLYLSLLHDFTELVAVYEKDEWRINAYIMPINKNNQEPYKVPFMCHPDYPIYAVWNMQKGTAHFAFIDVDDSMFFPEDIINPLPNELHEDARQAMLKHKVSTINQAIEESTAYAKNVAYHAELLDVDWSGAVPFKQLTQEVLNRVDAESMNKMNSAVAMIQRCLPKHESLIKRINKRFNTELSLVKQTKVKASKHKLRNNKKR